MASERQISTKSRQNLGESRRNLGESRRVSTKLGKSRQVSTKSRQNLGESRRNLGEISTGHNETRQISTNLGEISSNLGECRRNLGESRRISTNLGESRRISAKSRQISTNLDEIAMQISTKISAWIIGILERGEHHPSTAHFLLRSLWRPPPCLGKERTTSGEGLKSIADSFFAICIHFCPRLDIPRDSLRACGFTFGALSEGSHA